MTTSTWSEPSDRLSARPVFPSVAIGGKARTTVRCRLCQEVIPLETSFRPTTAACPHCGLKFTFDPQQEQEPLPVRGLRLRNSAASEAQHGAAAQPAQPDAQARAAIQFPQTETARAQTRPNLPEPKTNDLSGVGVLARALAAVAALFRGCWPGGPQRATGLEGSRCRWRRLQGVPSWLIPRRARGSANEDKTEDLTTDLDKTGRGAAPGNRPAAP
jgi:hypothetical protein